MPMRVWWSRAPRTVARHSTPSSNGPAGSFDAILMDIMMSVMDGYEAARAIRRSVKADAGSVPIFAMTANAFAEDAQRAHDAGMNGHLTKPIDMEKVKRALAIARR